MESYDVPLVEAVVEDPREGVLYEFDHTDEDGTPTGTSIGWWRPNVFIAAFDGGVWSAEYVTSWHQLDVVRTMGRPVVSAARAQDEPVRAVCSGGGPSRTPGMVLIEFMVPEGTPRRLNSEWLLSPIAEAVRDA